MYPLSLNHISLLSLIFFLLFLKADLKVSPVVWGRLTEESKALMTSLLNKVREGGGQEEKKGEGGERGREEERKKRGKKKKKR